MRHGALALPAGAFALDQAVAVTETNFPDQIFRSWLLDKSNLNGAGADGLLTGEELASITVMDLSRRDIQSLEGIEYFTALESLNVSNNRLTSLNVSGCPELVDLNCERNRLTELDLSRNTKLVQLYCRHNSLTQLDVSRNLELVFIETFDNSLTSFDCSMLKKLEFLHIDYNRLTTLNMSGNPALKDSGFVAANNHLNTLVLPNIPNFTVDADVFYEQNPRTGYDNVEWYLDAAHTRPVAPGDKLPANGQTLYARWVPNPYTVYYRANGGQGTMEPQSAVYGASFALTPNAFTRTGYTFDHWSTYSDGVGGRVFENGATVQDLAGRNSSRTAVYLYAQWRPNTYTIRFSEGAALRREIEAAEAAGMPGALLVAGKVNLEQVPPIPKTPAVTAWPAAAPLTRGQALKASALTGGKADVPGSFAWKEPDARPQAGGSFTVVFTPQDARRYETVEQQVQLTVQDPPVSTAPAAPAATPAPAVTPSPAPAATPAPATAKPSPTPAPTAAPEATATPSPSPSPAPSAAPESTSSAGQASGNGTSGGAGFALPLLAAGGAALLIAALLVLRARRRS
ncbi:MAG TPA: InlB B-repeat-containing protein [Candidatus Fournierella pullicola]|uniref:InlB B-repeat-containing protein n=1 Tax=Candidatus Allofournierella pullicola TaxID=2838596 RepID=A0A9D2AD89_9FIRM|nr:InlB B-repeat-containing protein [Candidatus Fournierella pullicola]